MSKDSSATHLHMHQPRLADLFEEFTKPYMSSAGISSGAGNNSLQSTGAHQSSGTNAGTYGTSTPSTIPSFLPIEDIHLQPQYQPSNPEDEDDVVPDQHAAFGIARAMERRHEPIWRDLGLEALVNGYGHGAGSASTANGVAGAGVGTGQLGPGATLRGSGGGAASASAPAVRVRSAGRLMGGRRVVSLR